MPKKITIHSKTTTNSPIDSPVASSTRRNKAKSNKFNNKNLKKKQKMEDIHYHANEESFGDGSLFV